MRSRPEPGGLCWSAASTAIGILPYFHPALYLFVAGVTIVVEAVRVRDERELLALCVCYRVDHIDVLVLKRRRADVVRSKPILVKLWKSRPTPHTKIIVSAQKLCDLTVLSRVDSVKVWDAVVYGAGGAAGTAAAEARAAKTRESVNIQGESIIIPGRRSNKSLHSHVTER